MCCKHHTSSLSLLSTFSSSSSSSFFFLFCLSVCLFLSLSHTHTWQGNDKENKEICQVELHPQNALHFSYILPRFIEHLVYSRKCSLISCFKQRASFSLVKVLYFCSRIPPGLNRDGTQADVHVHLKYNTH